MLLQLITMQSYNFIDYFRMFAVLNFQIMTFKQNSPVWYGGGMRKHRNALKGVGHLTYTGFIFPKLSDYE